MIPRVPKTGSSFLGAWKYYAHDKRTEEQRSRGEIVTSADRVAWTHTENLAGLEADRLAVNLMKLTATQNSYCKQSVYSFSLAWHPEQQPTKEHMIEAGLAALEVLGMEEHQAMFIAHRDTDHPHVHVMVNRIHPQTLKAKNNFQDFKRLSEWARGYEQEHGKIYCAERENRASKRDLNNGKNEHRYADGIILEAWNRSDNGKSFQAALEAKGWKFGLGDRKDRFMVVMPSGRPLDILREINKTRDKGDKLKLADIERRFADINRENLKKVADLQKEQERDREEQKTRDAFKRRTEAEAIKVLNAALYGEAQAEARRIEALHRRLHDQHIEQWRIQERQARIVRDRSEQEIEDTYQFKDMTDQIKAVQTKLNAKGTFWGRVSGSDQRQKAAAEHELKILRRTYAENLQKAEQNRQRVENLNRKDADELAHRQKQERDALPPIPERDYSRQPAQEQNNAPERVRQRQRARGYDPP
jgi:Relaxase/Mobilisation nuclease domain